MAGIVGEPRSYDKKFLFGVEIDDLDIGWFESISAIEEETGVVEQHSGGSHLVEDQSPGKTKWTPVTLTYGITKNTELYDWRQKVIRSGANSGEPDASYKKNLAIIQKDRDGTEKGRWTLYEAWPSKCVWGEWDAKAEENVIGQVTLTYKYAEYTRTA